MKIITVVLTHNSPNQLHVFLDRLRRRDPDFFAKSQVLVLNQSDEQFRPAYRDVCAFHEVECVCRVNRGASGGRFAAAWHFHDSDADAMFYFEDDMLLSDEPLRRCRFGFPNQVSNLFNKVVRIFEAETLDYLKLTFHEVYADHSRNFYDGRPARFDKLGSIDNEVGYFVGQIYYSNWPMLIQKEASEKLFYPPAVTEGDVVHRALNLAREGLLKTGVMAAFPILHTRIEERPGRVDLASPQE